ncbi:MAG: LPXTG cell wall anchor domain-containing protein [Clostridia bacterium]|nr:LPXTG cell wall anchor domain-containing protein [Clostridia bacterium]
MTTDLLLAVATGDSIPKGALIAGIAAVVVLAVLFLLPKFKKKDDNE